MMISEHYLENPDAVDIDQMPDISDIPSSDRNDGISWEFIDLPKPCVDGTGSQTFFMISKGNPNKLMVYLEGGGGGTDWLSTKLKTVTLSPKRKISSLISQMGVFDLTDDENPFQDWTIVFVPYGTGDLHTGNRVVEYDSMVPFHEKKVYHTGFVNFNTIMRWLTSQNSYEEAVLSGSSAGGYGVGLNFLKASELLDCPLTVISDAGPDVISSQNPDFSFEMTNRCWGYLDNVPEEAKEFVKEAGEPIYLLDWSFSKDKYSNVKYGIMADLRDMVLSTIFMKIGPSNYKDKLLEVFGDLKDKHPDRIFRFFKNHHLHTFLQYKRFYLSSIDGISTCKCTDLLVNDEPVDLVED